MALKFYDPRGPNLLNGSSCSRTRCLWNCFPWDVMPANVTVLTGLTSPRSRKDWLLVRGRTTEEMTCLRLPGLVHTSSLLFLSSFSISYSPPSVIPRLFHCRSPLASLLRALFYLLLTLLCPCYHGYWLLHMRWGFTRTDGRYRALWYSCHSSMSFSLSS